LQWSTFRLWVGQPGSMLSFLNIFLKSRFLRKSYIYDKWIIAYVCSF
jgi:hypothetical protein